MLIVRRAVTEPNGLISASTWASDSGRRHGRTMPRPELHPVRRRARSHRGSRLSCVGDLAVQVAKPVGDSA